MSTPTPDRLAATLSTIDGIGPLDTVAMDDGRRSPGRV